MKFGLVVEQIINNKDKYIFAVISGFRFKVDHLTSVKRKF